jgi:hypothetical protein
MIIMNLMKLEKMNATERVAEALQMRGLFVKVTNNLITLTAGNTMGDINKVHSLLNNLGIPTLWDGNSFQVLVNRLPIAMMKRIMNVPGREFPVNMEGYHFKWRAFAQRRFGIGVNAMDLDYNMAMLVKSLNFAGITTLAGCNGHHRYAPNVQLSGEFQGAWFSVIQEMYLSECKLHYKWQVHFGNQSGSCIYAIKEETTNWDMTLIYQDTVQMAQVLQKHAEEIRKLKLSTFKRNKEMKETANSWAQEKDFIGLVNWMKSKIA